MKNTDTQKKIRLAIMTDDFDRRPERTLFFRRIIEACLDNPDIDVTLVHSHPMPDEPLYARAREVLMPRVSLPWGSHFFTFIRYCLTTKDHYDIVHYFKGRLFPFFWLFPARHTVVMVHGAGDRLAPGTWTFPGFIFIRILIFFNRYIDAVIAVSDYANREIIYAYHIPPQKVHTIYPHIDQTFADPVSEETARSIFLSHGLEQGNYFFYIGRAGIHKNVGNLVEAFLRYRERNPLAHEQLVIGGDGRRGYERTFGPIRSSSYEKDVRFLGYIPSDHMPTLLRGARALAFVTLHEGFGVPIIEAFASGTPVITASVTAMPEVAGDAALIVDPHDPDALAEAFRRIATDETLRHELIKRGLKRSTLFSWDTVVKRTFGLYNEVLGRNKKNLIDPTFDTMPA